MSRTGARLGQHFLIHAWAARALAHAVSLKDGEVFVEIGPGKGILTRELLALGQVVAVEKDDGLIPRLHETFAEHLASGRLRLVHSDVRDVTPESLGVGAYVVAANIPYYITGEIIRQFLTAPHPPRALALLVQKEVAQRAVSSKESLLSLSIKAYGSPKITDKVSKKHFSPPPKVDSAILLIEGVSRDFFRDLSEDHFFAVLHAGFASKRKVVSNNLSTVYGKEQATAALEKAGVPEKARAEDIHLETWRRIALNLAHVK